MSDGRDPLDRLDAIGDALRRRDVELRGGNVATLLPFDQLSRPELTRWRALATAALDAQDALEA